ncbi:MAG TPA: amidase [Candidatus Limnocylindria bacterium]|nr:amidase [Candidatus Limnocylindria bacterium]
MQSEAERSSLADAPQQVSQPATTTATVPDRRSFLGYFSALGLGSTLFPGVLWGRLQDQKPPHVTKQLIRDAAAVSGLEFNDHQLEIMVEGVNKNIPHWDELRKIPLDNSVAPPIFFNPVVPGMKIDRTKRPFRGSAAPRVTRPRNLEDVAFWQVTQLAELIRTRQATSVELTEMYLARIKRLNPKLLCVVTVTEDLAMRQARDADKEIAAGHYRGPLHGIPWGVKDIIAAKDYPTTWGAAPFKNRIIDRDATVVSRLEAAGAVLVAKLTTGELALDDIWFGGQTKNPWDLSMGSQGSSAGPGSATAAGLVGFSVGTETGGSIVAPSAICGVTGLRPTFGRVSRYGVMTLSWSLDKTGPMCRSVEDCALVLNAIQGPDDRDLAVQDVPLNYDASLDIRKLRVGYLKASFQDTRQTPQVDANDAAALAKIRSLGFNLIEVELPPHANLDFPTIMYGEANAALRDPIETEPADLVRQDRVAGQMSYRLLPATEYLNAQRVRTLLMHEMARVMTDVDVYLVPFDYADYTPNPIATINNSVTNLTGQPCVALPTGFDEKGHPTSLTFIGKVYGEAEMLALARAYQNATDWHLKHPDLP